jgi:predicted NBD/HSP70 family sugar kinase
MKVELHLNGRLSVQLTPENDIERLVLAEMLEGHGKGKPVALTPIGVAEHGAAAVSVEK